MEKKSMIQLSEKLVAAINEQIMHEFSSAYSYLALSVYFEENNLPGFAHWMREQQKEEEEHGMRLFKLLLDHNAPVELKEIPKPQKDYDSPIAAVKFLLNHEREITKKVFDLYELALQEKAYSVKVELEWFIKEQVEEEKTALTLLEQLEHIGDDKAALLTLDLQLSQRTGSN